MPVATPFRRSHRPPPATLRALTDSRTPVAIFTCIFCHGRLKMFRQLSGIRSASGFFSGVPFLSLTWCIFMSYVDSALMARTPLSLLLATSSGISDDFYHHHSVLFSDSQTALYTLSALFVAPLRSAGGISLSL